MMDQYGDTYTANGIGLETVKAYERLQVEHTALLNMVYGPDGETPVEDDELTSHLDDSMYEICYISIPLYNTSTYALRTMTRRPRCSSWHRPLPTASTPQAARRSRIR